MLYAGKQNNNGEFFDEGKNNSINEKNLENDYEISNISRQSGMPLDSSVKELMESRFNFDFSNVKIHKDEQAGKLASNLNASAVTKGMNIMFGFGQYDPNTKNGQKLIAHELIHIIQNHKLNGSSTSRYNVERKDSPAEEEAYRISQLVQIGFNASPIVHNNSGIALTSTSRLITPLISYSAFDWAVTTAEERDVLVHLMRDPDISMTIIDLARTGMLEALITRIDDNDNRRQLLQILGSRLNLVARLFVEPFIASLGFQWELQYNLGRYGITSAATPFNTAPFAPLIGNSNRAPFTGSGATGVNPTSHMIGFWDTARLALGTSGAKAEYSNPLGNLSAYLATLTPTQRAQQAELLVKQPISVGGMIRGRTNYMPEIERSYAGKIPSRAQIIRVAAAINNLHPQLVAAILLAEQRDQSRNEDAKDYVGATSIKSANTSIGLGQVVISTARKNDLFQDLLSSSTRSGLSHETIALLLASDEFNIFAVARYIRQVADAGSRKAVTDLPNTFSIFPGIDLTKYALNSSTWPDDNIRTLGMYYTSRMWTDDTRSAGWGKFVFEAYRDVVASSVF
jgi:hypothetical protein